MAGTLILPGHAPVNSSHRPCPALTRSSRFAILPGLLLLMGVLFDSGCVRRYHQDYGHKVRLTIARGETQSTLSWNSAKNQVYTVMYRESAESPTWTYHPRGINILGTGGDMKFTDEHPRGSFRRYRLHLEPVTGRPLR